MDGTGTEPPSGTVRRVVVVPTLMNRLYSPRGWGSSKEGSEKKKVVDSGTG